MIDIGIYCEKCAWVSWVMVVALRFSSTKRQEAEASPLERPKKKKQNRSHMWRVNVIYGVIFLSFGSLVLRLGYLQVTQGAVYRTKAMTSSVQSVPILPARGRIYDTNGNLLAYRSAKLQCLLYPVERC